MMRNHCRYAAVLTFSLVLLLYMVAPARAAEVQPGDACTVAGQVMETGGPEQIPGRVLVCNGTTWKTVRENTVDGKILFQVNSDPGACNSDKQGRLRYTSASDIWEYCTGSAWSPFKKPLCQEDDTGECFLKLPRSVNDTDFMAANIASGVNILGIVGTHASVPTIAVNKISTAVLTKCFITSTGRAYCWGDYTCFYGDGQCANAWGVNISTINSSSGSNGWTHLAAPIEVYGGHTDWTAISTSAIHSCGIRGGLLYCWGENVSGELGTGNTTQYNTPQQVSGATTDWSIVAAGFRMTCAIKTSGRLYCWGFGGGGERGDGTFTNSQTTPVEVSGAYTDWIAVSAGGSSDDYPTSSTAAETWGSVCGLRSNGRLYCWGDGDIGSLGDGVSREWTLNNNQSSPWPVLLNIQ